MALLINDNGLSRILVLDAATRGVLGAGLSPPLGVISDAAFTHDGAMLALNINRDAAPQESGLYDWTQARFTPWSGGVAPNQTARISRPVAFTYASARHGAEPLRISALLHLPEAASENAPAPVVIVAHGGPESQSRATFNRLHNYYATELGVAVILPNIRGSSGYGRTFEQMDDGVRRSEAIDDIGALLDWIAARPALDADRVVITGGSYGGFVSLSALAAFPDRLRGAISRVGVADIPSFLANTEPYRVANRRLEYGDERDPEIGPALTRLSPLARAHAMTAPILVIHGANDPRVPLQQAEAIVAAVRANGQHAGFLVAGDEGHRFENANNRRWRDGAQVKFIRRTLLDEPQR
jgi:dipeptidyl aminopeptidase/acylaminoacyl peptidase